MKKIQISNWSRNTDLSEKTIFMLDNFVKCIRHYSGPVEIDFYCDTKTSEQVTDSVKENTNLIISLDKYNEKEAHEWSLVKVLTISEIPDEEVCHLDYDIILKSDVTHLISVLRDSGFDAVYQSIEGVSLHPYYKEFVKANPNVFDGLNKRCAFNGGLTYFKAKSVRESFEDLLGFYSESFGTYISKEQLAIPARIQQRGFTIGVLASMLHKFKTLDSSYIDNGLINEKGFLGLSKNGVFMPNIGYYHFLGPNFKESEELINGMKAISGIYE